MFKRKETDAQRIARWRSENAKQHHLFKQIPELGPGAYRCACGAYYGKTAKGWELFPSALGRPCRP